MKKLNLYGGRPPNQVEWHEIMSRRGTHYKPISEIEKYIATNSEHFDPINYMSRNQIRCLKLHYSVPTFPSDISALLSFNSEENTLTLFNFEEIEQDMNQGKGKPDKLRRLDKIDQQIDINDIQGFVYGSFLSRFWMLRIGMNQLILDNSKKAMKRSKSVNQAMEQYEKHRLKNDHESCSEQQQGVSPTDTSCAESEQDQVEVPFYAWQCISICLKNGHTLNLIIKDETDLKIFLLFLIKKLKSFDGARDTFETLFKANKANRSLSEGQIMQRIYKRYALMKL